MESRVRERPIPLRSLLHKLEYTPAAERVYEIAFSRRGIESVIKNL